LKRSWVFSFKTTWLNKSSKDSVIFQIRIWVVELKFMILYNGIVGYRGFSPDGNGIPRFWAWI
jgi:hypothetical protein